jgi:hypothetical protein
MGSGCRKLREDDGVAGLRMAWVVGIVGSGMARGAQRCRLKEDDVVAGSGMASWTWGRGLCGRWHHRLGSGKMAVRKGLDCGQE